LLRSRLTNANYRPHHRFCPRRLAGFFSGRAFWVEGTIATIERRCAQAKVEGARQVAQYIHDRVVEMEQEKEHVA
jgi:hypothetical protein